MVDVFQEDLGPFRSVADLDGHHVIGHVDNGGVHYGTVINDIPAVFPGVFYLDQHQFPADRFPFVKSLDLDDIDLFVQLFLDLFLGMLVPGTYNGHVGNSVVFRFTYRQGVDVEAASPEQSRNFTEHAGLVFY